MGISLIRKINGKFTCINAHSIFAIISVSGSSLKIEILDFWYFLFKPDNLVKLLKNMGVCVMDGCVYLFFFQHQKREINDKEWRGVSVSGVTWCKRVLWSFMTKRGGGWWLDQIRVILGWCNYWTAPFVCLTILN